MNADKSKARSGLVRILSMIVAGTNHQGFIGVHRRSSAVNLLFP
jgi:hypothetical protein